MLCNVAVVCALIVLGGAYGVPLGDRIVNGTDAKPGEIPYMVSVRFHHKHSCGGSILDSTHVLTAAHCMDFKEPDKLSVQYGITEIAEGEDAPNVALVKSFVVNPKYRPGRGYYNDVAILELEVYVKYGLKTYKKPSGNIAFTNLILQLVSPISFSPTVQPVQLPRAFNATPENCDATLSGWGFPSSAENFMTKLQTVKITVYSDEACEEAHELTGPTDRRYNICAGVPEGGKGQCTGDSGGPLVCDGVQIGVVSWSVKPCGVAGYPGVFAKVSAEVPFILFERLCDIIC